MTYPVDPYEPQPEQMQSQDETFDQVILIPLAKNPLGLNLLRDMHWATKARHTRQWRQFVALHAARFPTLSHATVTLTWYVTDRRRRDATNLWGLFKPCADGIVDAGVIPDDDSRYLDGYCRIERAEDPDSKVAWMELRIQGGPVDGTVNTP